MLSELKKEFLPSALFTFGNIAQFFRGGGGGPLPPHLARIRVEIPCCGDSPRKCIPPEEARGRAPRRETHYFQSRALIEPQPSETSERKHHVRTSCKCARGMHHHRHHHDNDASRDIEEPRTSPRPHRPSPATRGRVSPGSAGDGAGVREAERGEGDEKLVPSAIATAVSPSRPGRRRRRRRRRFGGGDSKATLSS